MKDLTRSIWPPALLDPSGLRAAVAHPAQTSGSDRADGRGQTMIIDKGLGRYAFADLLETAGDYMDCIKIGFGTAPLSKTELLLYKIEQAKLRGLLIMPGGTLLETAVKQELVPEFFDTVCKFGFNAIEVSDGTIELSRGLRTALIQEGIRNGLQVVTEYGKKLTGSLVDASELVETAEVDLAAGAKYVTVEARESGVGVGLFDDKGNCREDMLDGICRFVSDPGRLMWEAPLKHQQVLLLQTFGPGVHLGNIPPGDALALETMRRGLRSDTFGFGDTPENRKCIEYMI
ncbi:phosphosulfolactate synthase [Paenibacillus methanolicus]|uniref:Phosphosulfolactate synthase n=1 Tax=Paenibacillus methanolicus TaxID=582686 RepID=A0A5S5CFE4_9BACL|nr:phosphosulfolactate synthase [Paenibacillus methanolicus]TYP77879.1 phosphosulfolactate synthase [Paenibacillus methanolicus]